MKDVIRLQLVLAITGREALTDHERDVLALPARFGGIGVRNPTAQANEYNYAQQLSAPLTALTMEQSEDLREALEQQQAIKQTLWAEQVSELKDKAIELQNRLPQHLARRRH